MALRKPPKTDATAHGESGIDPKTLAFIQGAPDAERVVQPSGKRQQINIKFDDAFLAKIDADARKRGMNRTAWITFACSELLERAGDRR
jgi:hypothetical protein